jgi:hypothetical protein
MEEKAKRYKETDKYIKRREIRQEKYNRITQNKNKKIKKVETQTKRPRKGQNRPVADVSS